MSLAARALWIIERNSDGQISLPDLAQSCGVSRSHLAHAFASATGTSAMKYLRNRRLSHAARTIAAGAPDILSVALATGYNSHEAFTRAFRDLYGITPEALRERGSVDDLALTEAMDLPAETSRPPLKLRIEKAEAMLVVGLSATHSYDNTAEIPAQWQRFMEMCAAIPYQAEDIPIGIGQVPDYDGRFRYLCGIEVSSFGDLPRGLEPAKVAACDYAVFEHNEHVSGLYDTYSRIWNEALPQAGYQVAYAPIVERHNPTFNPATGEGGLTLWVPLVRQE